VCNCFWWCVSYVVFVVNVVRKSSYKVVEVLKLWLIFIAPSLGSYLAYPIPEVWLSVFFLFYLSYLRTRHLFPRLSHLLRAWVEPSSKVLSNHGTHNEWPSLWGFSIFVDFFLPGGACLYFLSHSPLEFWTKKHFKFCIGSDSCTYSIPFPQYIAHL